MSTIVYRNGIAYVEETGAPVVSVLDQYKAIKRNTLNVRLNKKEQENIVWGGSTFNADRASLGRIGAAVNAVVLPVAWTLADDTDRTMGLTDLLALQKAICARMLSLHITVRSLKAQIAAATTTAQVDAVVWPGD